MSKNEIEDDDDDTPIPQHGVFDWYDNWDMALADALAEAGVCLTEDHDIGDLTNLMTQIEEYFAGDLQAACNAIRTGKLTFEPFDDWFRVIVS